MKVKSQGSASVPLSTSVQLMSIKPPSTNLISLPCEMVSSVPSPSSSWNVVEPVAAPPTLSTYALIALADASESSLTLTPSAKFVSNAATSESPVTDREVRYVLVSISYVSEPVLLMKPVSLSGMSVCITAPAAFTLVASVTSALASIASNLVICVEVARPVCEAVAFGMADVYCTFGLLRILASPLDAFQSDWTFTSAPVAMPLSLVLSAEVITEPLPASVIPSILAMVTASSTILAVVTASS